MTVLGADACPAGWVIVTLASSPRGNEAVTVGSVETLRAMARTAAIVGIDIPIGLPNRGVRLCDVEARRLLGPRRGTSVFPAPTRAWVDTANYEAALCLARASNGRGISKQAFNIAHRVREVDTAIRGDTAFRARVREVHPELAFMRLHGSPVIASKRTPEGVAIRQRLLEHTLGRDRLHQLLAVRPRGCALHDLIDAVVVAWTASRIAAGEAQGRPESPSSDQFGIEMRIWF